MLYNNLYIIKFNATPQKYNQDPLLSYGTQFENLFSKIIVSQSNRNICTGALYVTCMEKSKTRARPQYRVVVVI